ncbi:E3 ubiquitin-protein ligase RNF166-like isoform X2 [Culex pipiens pallens]|uniref:E3 ubiquitin-protein ligase RNF166-like isoform X2 n=1 Tax=Culex pipiens pallens TaxID=42434 RepID=UPI00195311B1|nr:E3 ubiquitin-protein ligase RNF166-like isoform X2 [Culex pipiens pallens]
MADVHTGITCSVCDGKDFVGTRYVCLICWDYDLCQKCYEEKRCTARHRPHHPMQSVISREDFFKSTQSAVAVDEVRLCCPFCGERELNLAALLQHNQQNHAEEAESVRCPVCVTYNVPGNSLLDGLFLEHLRNEHSELDEGISCTTCQKKPFAGNRYACLVCHNYDLCEECHTGKRFSKHHLPYHPMQQIMPKEAYAVQNPPPERIFRCPYCGDGELSASGLRDHCQELHQNCPGIRVRCSICGVCRVPYKNFTLLKCSLLDHLRDYHGLKGAPEPEPEVIRPIECSICFLELEAEIVTERYCQCRHEEFHEKCIREWLAINPTCPVCRAMQKP